MISVLNIQKRLINIIAIKESKIDILQSKWQSVLFKVTKGCINDKDIGVKGLKLCRKIALINPKIRHAALKAYL